MGDFDIDGDIDLDDFGEFFACVSGPKGGPNYVKPPPECADVFDFDEDEDIDLVDFGAVALRFTGVRD